MSSEEITRMCSASTKSNKPDSMRGDNVAVQVNDVSKCYHLYDKPQDRLRQYIYPRVQRIMGREPKAYAREFWALRGVSFHVKKGETVGIIGRNGSGKSTLLQLVCGTLAPTIGTIETHGRVAALLELGAGFNPEFTGRENAYMNGALLGLSRAEIDARFDEIATFADIGEFIEQPVKTYSSGMYVRLAFAVMAHVNADILVIDEALAVGDAFFTQKCMRFLRDFMKRGTVLFVSHDTGSVKALCNSAIWLEKGRILQIGSPKEICDLYLEAFYEAQQGKSTTTKLKPAKPESGIQKRDPRLDLIQQSVLRNDLHVFEFDPDAPSFGKGGAQIIDVYLLDKAGLHVTWVVGGEEVILRVTARGHQSLSSPIIGFFIKDRLGQALFGDNTYLTYQNNPVTCETGFDLQADFTFHMPLLPRGDYSINVAVADGTQENHVQHHWVHDAVLFRSENSSITKGLIGVPIDEIRLQVLKRSV